MDTWPKMFGLCFPGRSYRLDKTSWFAELDNGSQVWFGGLDDKERVDKILGNEYATIFLNECSQITWGARNIALTRLAQKAAIDAKGPKGEIFAGDLLPRMIYDQNPPDNSHWSYRVFEQGIDPESRQPILNRKAYASIQLNPADNATNLPSGYLDTLRGMGSRHQRRFLLGEYRDATPGQLFSEVDIDKWRVLDGVLPQFVRVIVAVDPSGSGDRDNAENDAIGITVMGLGTDGVGYVLEDLTVKAGPATWGRVATSAYDRHQADMVVGEANFGGDMVRHTIQTARPGTPYKAVSASRGKAVRAEPISALVETGKVRMVGYFRELEDELSGFTTTGYVGDGSPNRADSMVWAATELFGSIVAGLGERDLGMFGRKSKDYARAYDPFAAR